MEIYQPYTYLIRFKPTGQVYYGVRYANGKNNIANPIDLWNTYFTSSQIIKKLLLEYGSESFNYQVRHTFDTKEQAIKWEKDVLTRFNAKSDPNWINQTNGHNDFYLTEEAKRKMSISHIGKLRPPMTEEQKAKISSTRLARKIQHSDETKLKMSQNSQGEHNPNYGKHHSDETKAKQSLAATGRLSSLKGVPKTDEQKAKQSATMKRKHQERIQHL